MNERLKTHSKTQKKSADLVSNKLRIGVFQRYQMKCKSVSKKSPRYMLLDIDRFKLVNDTYGHLIGDVVLRTLATYLASWTRDYETVYRYGGEEFIIIVKAANDEEACRAGVRICQLVDNHAITHSEGHINITVTAGVSRAFPEEPLDVVIGRADRAMYEGKQTGRNRCMFIDEQNVINRV
ncbi:diguanylate cyclase [Escherichia coli]|uniref:diguanylate cyclase n=1 Tax=Escherichia coli TaxID=562 RepID=UPI002024A461|nr:diguanylate cyclase [Escherichia coli]